MFTLTLQKDGGVTDVGLKATTVKMGYKVTKVNVKRMGVWAKVEKELHKGKGKEILK